MKRLTLLATVTAAAVVLVGCSSKSGTATPVASSSAASSPALSAATSGAPVSGPATHSAVASSAPASAPAPSSASVASPVVTTSVRRSAPTTTVGGNSRALDAPSTAWFTAFCGGLSPVLDISKSVGSVGTDSAAAQQKVVTLFGTLGAALTTTATTLKRLPPPTFTGGPAFAARVITAFGTSGPAITRAATKIAADPSSLTSSMGGLTDSLTTAVQPLEELGTLKLTPATQAAIEAIPACAKVQSLGGG